MTFSAEETPVDANIREDGFDWVCHEIPGFNSGFAVDLPGPLPPSSAQSLGHGDGFGASYHQHWWPRRCLYATVVMSVALYGAPIWAQTVADNRGILRYARRLQQQLALRIIHEYRTISHEAAAVLSEMVPFDIIANRLRMSYLRRRDIIARNGVIAPRVSLMLIEMERRRCLEVE